MSPGASPGTVTADSGTWAGGASYDWDINNATGTPGTTDLLAFNNALTITATATERFIVRVKSLTPLNQPGLLPGFDPQNNYTWTIAQAGSVTGFDANAFTLDTTGFASPVAGGTFALQQSGGNLQLTFQTAGPGDKVITTISGTVNYYGGTKTVPGVSIAVSGDLSTTVVTDAAGAFSFVADAGARFAVAPGKTTETPVYQGVTTLDLAMIRRHILGIASLDSPYRILAADVNDSSVVTTLDMALIRRVILATSDGFPGGLWSFVPSDFQFGDPLNPWPIESARSYSGLIENKPGQDFVGIKHGDVNGSWTAPVVTPSVLSAGNTGRQTALQSAGATVGFSVGEPVEAGAATVAKSIGSGVTRRVNIPVTISNFENVTSAQFTLEWDPNTMEYAGVNGNGVRGLDAGNFGTRYVGDGKLTFSWDDPEGTGLSLESSTALFSVAMNVKSARESGLQLRFADQPTLREVTVRGELGNILTSDGSLVGPAQAGTGFTEVSLGNGVFQFTLPTEVGLKYTVERSESVTGSEWQELIEMMGDGLDHRIVDSDAGGDVRFYRIRVLPGNNP